MQRILSLYDWGLLEPGKGVFIRSTVEGLRSVRLRVNAPSPAVLYVKQADIPDAMFLARVEGLDEIQFNLEGDYELVAVGGEVWLDTLDGSSAHVEPVETASFTRIVERRARNPELEIMERRMAENMERRMALLTNSVTSILAEKEAELVAARTAANAASPAVSEPDAGQVSPVEPAPAVESGNAE